MCSSDLALARLCLSPRQMQRGREPARAGADAALVVVEGLMGLFDGVPAAAGRSGSSADVARALGLPVVLVLDVSGQAQSAAAVALGFANYRSDVRLAGVILNKASDLALKDAFPDDKHLRTHAEKVYFGGPDGPSEVPDWEVAFSPQNSYHSLQVAGGDLNGDGLSDVVDGGTVVIRAHGVTPAVIDQVPTGEYEINFVRPGWRSVGAEWLRLTG